MSPPPPPPCAGDGGGDEGGEEAKAAGFVVFSGIAMNIVKALAFKPPQPHSPPSPSPYPSRSPSPQEKLVVEEEPRVEAPKSLVVEIARGDTLWGLSRRYGVSIDSIREVNGITGDKIYAGKKLIIP